MTDKMPRAVAASLLACLLVAPGCFDVDDAPTSDLDGSSGGDSSGNDSVDPSGNDTADPPGSTSSDPTVGETGDDDPSGTTGGTDETDGDDTSAEDSSGDDDTTGAVDAPAVVEVLPEDGAVGVDADAPLVIRFSEPMDKAATQAAYQSSDIPGVTFSWNEAGDVLTIVPNTALTYAEGTNPMTTEALEYTFTISNAAESESGASLEADTEVTFSTLRRLSLSLEQDDTLSGRVRDLGGSALLAGSYALGDNNINDTARGFVTFDVSALPEGPVTVENANLHARFSTVIGNPFIDLGAVVFQHVNYDTFDDALFDAPTLGTASGLFGTINDDVVDRDVTGIATTAIDDPETFGERVQFRFRWIFNETDNDGQSDSVTLIAGDLRLDLQVLVP